MQRRSSVIELGILLMQRCSSLADLGLAFAQRRISLRLLSHIALV